MYQVIALILATLWCYSAVAQTGGFPPPGSLSIPELKDAIKRANAGSKGATDWHMQTTKDFFAYRYNHGLRDPSTDPSWNPKIDKIFEDRMKEAGRKSVEMINIRRDLEQELSSRPGGGGRRGGSLFGPPKPPKATEPGLRNTVPMRDTVDMRNTANLPASPHGPTLIDKGGAAAEDALGIPKPRKPPC